jgi:hypothetical protein
LGSISALARIFSISWLKSLLAKLAILNLLKIFRSYKSIFLLNDPFGTSPSASSEGVCDGLLKRNEGSSKIIQIKRPLMTWSVFCLMYSKSERTLSFLCEP